ncbi:MAG: DUF11 domain-containing protein [Chloroflexi bacterium]|nr:DUF11 domain-containing protein [Chloroflexota bacterium]
MIPTMIHKQERNLGQAQRGYALLFVIIAVTVGVLVITPVITFLSSALFGAERTLTQTEYRLAREAGAEYAIATLKNDRPLLTSLSSQELIPVNMPLPPVAVSDKTATSVTATLLTPSQWDLVELPSNHATLYASLAPVGLPVMATETTSNPALGNADGRVSSFEKEPVPYAGLRTLFRTGLIREGSGGILSHLFLPPPKEPVAMPMAPVAVVSKTVSPGQVSPGEQVTYTITVNNSGDQTAAPTSVVDTLPSGSGFSYLTGSTTGAITANPKITGGGRTLTWDDVPTIAPGGSLVFSFRVLTGSSTGTFYNQAQVQGNFSTTSTGNTAPVFVGPKMRIVKTVAPSAAPAGTNVTYTMTIYNDTAGTDAGLTSVKDTLPAGFSYISNSTAGTITANPSITGQVNLTWNGTWTVPGGGSFTFSFQANTTTDWGTFYNSVSISGTNFPDVSTGPTAAVTTVGWIQITKTVDNPTPGASETVTYTVTVNNVGPNAVSISKITDDKPNLFTYVSGSTSGAVSGNPSITGNTLTWQGAQIPSSIAAGASFTFSFQAIVPDTSNTYYDEGKIYVNWLDKNYTITTGPTAPVTVVTQARIVISEASGDKSGPPGWSNVNVTGYGFAPQKTVKLYWVDLNNQLSPLTDPPIGTDLLPDQTLITLSTSYAPLSFNPVSITIPSNANWGNGWIVAVMLDGSSWVEQDRKPFNVRAKYEIKSRTDDGNTLTARVAYTGTRSPDGIFSTPTNTPVITIYSWRE